MTANSGGQQIGSYVHNSNVALGATPLALLTTGNNEVADIYDLAVSGVSGSGGGTNCTIRIIDNVTGIIYFTASATLTTAYGVTSSLDPNIRMTPNSSLEFFLGPNVATYTIKVRAVTYGQ